MLEKINARLTKMMPFLTPTSLIMGVLIGKRLEHLVFLIPWIFAFMTFSGSLGSNFKQFKNVLQRPFPIVIAVAFLHVFMPLLALSIGHLIFGGDPFTITGFILAVVIPTGITSFVWVSIYSGNAVLCLSIILIDTLLSPIVVPYSLQLLIGAKVNVDTWQLMRDMFFMIVIPSVLGMEVNQLTRGEAKKWGTKLSLFSKLGIAVIVLINGAVLTPYLKNMNMKVLLIIACVFVISASGYFFSWLVGALLNWKRDETVTLMYNGGMRNISAGSVLAVTFFPPPVVLPVVLGMLFQQVLAATYGRLFFDESKRRVKQKPAS